MSDTLTYTDTLTIIECGNCHIPFAIPRSLCQARHQDGRDFWCPNGCMIHYSDPENKRLKRQLESARAQATHERDQRHAAERSASAYKGQATRLRNRAAAGVCPVDGCKRHFANLAAHMETKHPGYPETTEA